MSKQGRKSTKAPPSEGSTAEILASPTDRYRHCLQLGGATVGALLDWAGHHRVEGTSGGVGGGAVPPAPAPTDFHSLIPRPETFEVKLRQTFIALAVSIIWIQEREDVH